MNDNRMHVRMLHVCMHVWHISGVYMHVVSARCIFTCMYVNMS